MPRKKNDIHYIYKTTCLITNRYYVGMHSTSNLDDGYMGSGKRLRYSIRKYGINNHKREIIKFFDDRKSLIIAEKNMITTEMINDNNCMNLKCGGTGGLDGLPDNIIKKIRDSASNYQKQKWQDKNYVNEFKLKSINGVKRGHKLGHYKYDNFKNRKHTEESKIKMSNSSKGIGVGSTNSQHNTCWITNGLINKKIKKEDFNKWLKIGWIKGRKIINAPLV